MRMTLAMKIAMIECNDDVDMKGLGWLGDGSEWWDAREPLAHHHQHGCACSRSATCFADTQLAVARVLQWNSLLWKLKKKKRKHLPSTTNMAALADTLLSVACALLCKYSTCSYCAFSSTCPPTPTYLCLQILCLQQVPCNKITAVLLQLLCLQ